MVQVDAAGSYVVEAAARGGGCNGRLRGGRAYCLPRDDAFALAVLSALAAAFFAVSAVNA